MSAGASISVSARAGTSTSRERSRSRGRSRERTRSRSSGGENAVRKSESTTRSASSEKKGAPTSRTRSRSRSPSRSRETKEEKKIGRTDAEGVGGGGGGGEGVVSRGAPNVIYETVVRQSNEMPVLTSSRMIQLALQPLARFPKKNQIAGDWITEHGWNRPVFAEALLVRIAHSPAFTDWRRGITESGIPASQEDAIQLTRQWSVDLTGEQESDRQDPVTLDTFPITAVLAVRHGWYAPRKCVDIVSLRFRFVRWEAEHSLKKRSDTSPEWNRGRPEIDLASFAPFSRATWDFITTSTLPHRENAKLVVQIKNDWSTILRDIQESSEPNEQFTRVLIVAIKSATYFLKHTYKFAVYRDVFADLVTRTQRFAPGVASQLKQFLAALG